MSSPARLFWQRVAPRADVLPALEPHALRAALAADPALRCMLVAGEPILLVVNDPARATPTGAILAQLAAVCATLTPPPTFRALVATGTHRFAPAVREAFERETFGGLSLRIESVRWHAADDHAGHVELAGVQLDRGVADHRHLLAIGSVEPHYFAGATGAHKSVTIGGMAVADVARNHAGALHPDSDAFVLRGNPVFDGIALILHKLQAAGKQIIAINALNPGGTARAVRIGDPLTTLRELLPLAQAVYRHETPRPVDLLHLRVPPPLGANLYQADKALKNSHRAVRDRGGIVLEAECPEGVGPDAFLELLRRAPDHRTAAEIVAREGYRFGDHKAVKLRHLTDPAGRGVRIALVSRYVTDADAELVGMRRFDTASGALAWIADAAGEPCLNGLLVDDAANMVCQGPAFPAPRDMGP